MRGDDRHRVGDEAAAHHVRQALDVDERRGPHVDAVRARPAVAGDVAAELAARALDGDVDLALGHLEALGEDLEVVDQRLHRLVDAGPRRRRHLLVLDPVVAGRHAVEDLAHDAHRLADLVEPDGVAVEGVAVRADDDVEVDLRVLHVRHAAADVPVDAGRAQHRAGGGEGDGLGRRDHADALQPLPPDRLAGHQRVVLVEPRRDQLEQPQHVVAPARRQVGGDATDADEVVVHPQAGDLLEEAQHLLALAPAVDHHRHGAEVHAVGGQEQQVAGHPVELGQQHADPHRPLGDVVVDAEQLLGGEGERQLVEERAEVVHPRDVRAALQVRQLLAGLLHAGVQVADDRLAPQHRLALHLQHQPQHAVGARVGRAHVEDHRLVLVGVLGQVAELRRLGLAHPQHGADLAQQLLGRDLRARLELLRLLRRLPDQRRAPACSGVSVTSAPP